jgi:hypothetical protein
MSPRDGSHPDAVTMTPIARGRLGLLAFCLAVSVPTAAAADPVISLWYRGTPAGVPRPDDLALIRAHGFRAVTWPSSQVAGLSELSRLAEAYDLAVVVQPTVSAAPLRGRLDVPVGRGRASDLPAIVWRALSHGARIISFDSGARHGAGLGQPGSQTPDWVAPAAALSRQIGANGPLFDQLRPASGVRFESSRPLSMEVALLEGGRSWVIVATNTGGRARTVVQLPAQVPNALWVSLVDGETMGMLGEPSGPRWTVELDRGEAQVYVIDKSMGQVLPAPSP